MELKDQLAGKTPEEQTAWLKAHMHNWDEFIQGIVESEQELEEWHAAVPDYRIADGVELLYSAGLRSIDNLELVW